MKDLKRVIHIDFHTMPGIYNFNENFNAEEFADILKKSNVAYVNVFCKCNIGFVYYDSKIGTPYPGMKGDMFGDILKACHKRGIGVSAYFNVGLDHLNAVKHRDWLTINKDGTIYKENKEDSFFRTMCYHSAYRDYIKSLIKEVVSKYDIDGIFLDCFDVRPCYGGECIDDMKKEGCNPLDEKEVYEFARKDYLNLCKEIKEIVGKDKYFYINGWRDYISNKGVLDGVVTHSEIEGLPSSLGYDYYATNIAYARVLKDKLLYMTGRFQFSWGDLGGYKGKASLENDMWDALMNGADFCVGDHMNPAQNLDRVIYNDIKLLYTDLMEYEKYTLTSKYVADIGVMCDGKVYENRYFGVSRLLNELKYSFDFVDEDSELDKYKIIILPDDMRINDKITNKLKKHLDQNKGVICVGEGGLNLAGDKFSLKEENHEFCGLDSENFSFYKSNNKELNCGDFCWSTYISGILYKTKGDRIATYVKGYFKKKWDGEQCYIYLPPDRETDYSVLSRSGNIFRISFKLFKAYKEFAMKSHKDLIKYCISNLLLKPSFIPVDFPSTARVSITENNENVQLHVKATFPEKRGDLEIVEDHQYLPQGKVVNVLGKYKKAFEPLTHKEIKIEENGDYTKVILPEIFGYIMVILEK